MTSWRDDAACRDWPAPFYPDHTTGDAYDAALAICAGCPVRAECLEAALAAERRQRGRTVRGVRRDDAGAAGTDGATAEARGGRVMSLTYRDATSRRDDRLCDWRTRLDARISRCPGCDQWCWDHQCPACTVTEGAS